MEGAGYEGEMLLLMLPVLSWCLNSEINAPVGAGMRLAVLFLCSAMKPHHLLLCLAWKRNPFKALGFCLHSYWPNFMLRKALQNRTCFSCRWEMLVGVVGWRGTTWCGRAHGFTTVLADMEHSALAGWCWRCIADALLKLFRVWASPGGSRVRMEPVCELRGDGLVQW